MTAAHSRHINAQSDFIGLDAKRPFSLVEDTGTVYLARKHIHGKAHYVIRESFREREALLWRDLCDLGTDPARHIVYPGGNAFYIDDAVEERIRSLGSEPVPEEMENMFWPFLRPDIRYKLEPFRRQERRRRDDRKAPENPSPDSVHLFDRRRVHFLGVREDVDRLLNEFTMLVHAARQEPLGRVLLEAMAMGNPVVAMLSYWVS